MRFQPLITMWIMIPLLLAIAGAAIYFGYRNRKQLIKLVKNFNPKVIDKYWLLAKLKKIQPKWARRVGIAVLLLIIAFGPSIPGGVSSPGVANLDIVFAVDTTSSMGAQDYNGTKLRLEGIKNDMLAIGNRLKGAHFAIVTFDSKSELLLPFTADATTFTAAVQTMNREIYDTSKGSTIDQPLDMIGQQFKNSKALHPERSRLLFYLGDGEQTADNPVKSFDSLAKQINGGAVLGYGTSKGAKMIRYNGFTDAKATPEYVNTIDLNTKKFVPAVSKLDEPALKKIAKDLGVNYQNRNKGESLDGVIKASKADLLIDQGKKITHYLNLYWLFAIPFTALLFWEWKALLLEVIKLREGHGHGAAPKGGKNA